LLGRRRRRDWLDRYVLQFGGVRVRRMLAARMAEVIFSRGGGERVRVPVDLVGAIDGWLERMPPRERVEWACQFGIAPPPDEWRRLALLERYPAS